MKLFHKIFLCFVLLFGIAFQAAGFLLVNYAYGNAIEQEKKYAFQEFQQNKYILQSILYLEPELFEKAKSMLMIPDYFHFLLMHGFPAHTVPEDSNPLCKKNQCTVLTLHSLTLWNPAG